MLQLPNNCRIGNIAVSPKNWNTDKADINLNWTITYRFYDDNLRKNKQVRRQGMNEFSTLKERQEFTANLIQDEISYLKSGFNPILKKIIDVLGDQSNLPTPKTKFSDALRMAQKTLKLSDFTANDMETIIANITDAANKIFIDNIPISKTPISEVRKKHVRSVLNSLSEKNNWSAHSWNKYRSYLMIIYKELSEYDAVESNIPREISKRKAVKNVRVVLSESERKRVREALEFKNRRFWLFINMFFHSGARISEFFRIKVGDINIERQTVIVKIEKGRKYIEVVKPIKDIALPFWKEYISGSYKKEMFLMGKGLFPAEKPIRYDQINHRWQRVKKNLNIEADFYSLKHLNTDQVSERIGIEKAQKLNSHTSVSTTKIYAINENVRDMEIIKKVANEF